MEIIGPINLLYILLTAHAHSPDGVLPLWHKLIAALYILHYLNRAVITPLFLTPSMSPIHIIVITMGVFFNFCNSSCLAGWLLGYGTPMVWPAAPPAAQSGPSYLPITYLPYIGLFIFFIGMYGNVQAEGTLFRLRREEADRRVAKTPDKGDKSRNRYDKVYVLPPATGYFRSILFPHYVLEWIEWFGFFLIGFSVTPVPLATSTPVLLAPHYAALANLLLNRWGLPFPLPAILPMVNIITATMPRASWGRKWYVEKFSEKAVGGRGSFIPYIKWL
jgi:3-oxo-5-alpha-steroid 4-dehydrogenase 1